MMTIEQALAEMSALQEAYAADTSQNQFKLLLCGHPGSGKTWFTHTAPTPIHYDSFDPGGTKAIRQFFGENTHIVDSRWEKEDREDPRAFQVWLKEFNRRRSKGYFNHIATYVLDSQTRFERSGMNKILKDRGAAGSAPLWQKDYTPQKFEILNAILKVVDLPCNVIVIAHLYPEYDDDGKIINYNIITTGQNRVDIPALFDEIWVMDPRERSSGTEYRIRTQSTNLLTARTRMPNLEAIETLTLREMLEKGGFFNE